MARRRVVPIRARVKDAKRYTATIRARVWVPLFRRIDRETAGAETLAEGLAAIGLVPDVPAPLAEIERYLLHLNRYHLARTVQTFKTATGRDVRGEVARQFIDQLRDPRLKRMLREAVNENVNLIGNVSDRTKRRLRGRIMTAVEKATRLREGPVPAGEFKRLMLQAVLKEKRVTMSSIRLITKDQTTKTIGALTQIRQESLGLTHYRWRTQGDDRVRPEHAARNGSVFPWASAPAGGHPGSEIQCRCVAEAIVPPLWEDRP